MMQFNNLITKFKVLFVVFFVCLSVISTSLNVNFSKFPLKDALTYISSTEKVSFVYPSEIEEITVTLQLQNVDLETLLRMMLLPLGLDYEFIDKDICVIMTSKNENYIPKYITTYRPSFANPQDISKVLERLGIENYILNGQNIFYTHTKEQNARIMNLISSLDNQNNPSQGMVVLRMTYLYSDNIRTSKNLTLESILANHYPIIDKFISSTTYYSYIPFSWKSTISENESETLQDTSTSNREFSVASHKIENSSGNLSVQLILKNGTLIARCESSSESDSGMVDVPVVDINSNTTGTQFGKLRFKDSVLFIEAYYINLSKFSQMEKTTTTSFNRDNISFSNNSLSLLFMHPTLELSLSNQKHKFTAVFDVTDLSTNTSLSNVEILSNIIQNTYVGFSYDFRGNMFRLVLEESIGFWNFNLNPRILYNVGDNSFRASFTGNFRIPISNFSIELAFWSQISLVSNTNIGYGVAFEMRQAPLSYKLGVVISSDKYGFYGQLRW